MLWEDFWNQLKKCYLEISAARGSAARGQGVTFNKYLLVAQLIYKSLAFSDLADLAVYGVLSAIEGCDAFQDLLNNTKVAKWYNRVKEACRLHKGQSIFTEQDKVMDWYDCK